MMSRGIEDYVLNIGDAQGHDRDAEPAGFRAPAGASAEEPLTID